MSDNGFTRQFAIVMPNGNLYCSAASDTYMGSIFGSMFGDAKEPSPAVWDTRDEADAYLKALRRRANQVGVTDWFGVVVQRLCTPFTHTDPAEHLVGELQSWLEDQGGAS